MIAYRSRTRERSGERRTIRGSAPVSFARSAGGGTLRRSQRGNDGVGDMSKTVNDHLARMAAAKQLYEHRIRELEIEAAAAEGSGRRLLEAKIRNRVLRVKEIDRKAARLTEVAERSRLARIRTLQA